MDRAGVTDDEVAAIEAACGRLVTAYTHLVDDGSAGEVPTLFTDDAVWEAPGTTMRGRDEIAAGFEARASSSRESRHVCTNFGLHRVTADEAEGSVYLTLYRRDRQDGASGPLAVDGPSLIGVYRDRFVLTDDGWRIAHRRLDVSFVRGNRTP